MVALVTCVSPKDLALLLCYARVWQEAKGKGHGFFCNGSPNSICYLICKFSLLSTCSGVVWRWELPQAFANAVCFAEIHRASTLEKTRLPSHAAVGLLKVLEWRRITLESLYKSSNNSLFPHSMPTPHPPKHSRNAIQSIFLWVL